MNWKVKSLLRNVRTFFYTFTMKSIHLSISALDQFSSGDFFDPSNYHNYRKICKIKFLTIKRNKDKLVSAWKIKRKNTEQNKNITNWKKIKNENLCFEWRLTIHFFQSGLPSNQLCGYPLFLMLLFIENQASGIRIIRLWFLYSIHYVSLKIYVCTISNEESNSV